MAGLKVKVAGLEQIQTQFKALQVEHERANVLASKCTNFFLFDFYVHLLGFASLLV